MPRRCELGCEQSDVSLHTFPDPTKYPERFREWVRIVGGKLETSHDYEEFRKKKFCDIHFTEIDRNRNNRLNALAVPTVHLPSQIAAKTQPQLSTSLSSVSESVFTPPSTSDTAHIADVAELSTNSESEKTAATTMSLGFKVKATSTDVVMMEHNYCGPKDYNTTTVKYARKCIKSVTDRKVRALRFEICRLRKKGKSLKARLNDAEKLSSNDLFNKGHCLILYGSWTKCCLEYSHSTFCSSDHH